MKISAFLVETSTSQSDDNNNAVVFSSESGCLNSNCFELVALNVPRAKTQSVKNTINMLARRQIQEGQVVFSDGLEFKTLEAKGDMRSIILKQFMPEADPKSKVMILLPREGSQVFDSLQHVFNGSTGELVQQVAA
jgi:hypothetical protein